MLPGLRGSSVGPSYTFAISVMAVIPATREGGHGSVQKKQAKRREPDRKGDEHAELSTTKTKLSSGLGKRATDRGPSVAPLKKKKKLSEGTSVSDAELAFAKAEAKGKKSGEKKKRRVVTTTSKDATSVTNSEPVATDNGVTPRKNLPEKEAGTKELVDRAKVLEAVKVLFKQVRKQGNILADDSEYISLVVGLKKVPSKRRVKPMRLPLPSPLYKSGASEICFFVKDPQRAVKDYLEKHGSCGVTKVMGLTKLRERYKSFEARRQLHAQYDLFLADDRVIPMLPKLLGKEFFRSKKLPAPVKMGGDVTKELESAISCSYLHLGGGSCVSIKVGSTRHERKDVTDNAAACIRLLDKSIPGGHNNIQSLHLKVREKLSVPIFNRIPI